MSPRILLLLSLPAIACRSAALPASELAPTGRPEGTVTRVTARAAVPLRGFRVDAQPGDFLLRHERHLAVVTPAGLIIDFGPEGGEDELVAIEPAVFRGLDLEPAELVRSAAAGGAVHVEKRLLGGRLRAHTWIYFSGTNLVVERALVLAGAPLAQTFTLGEIVAWGNLPTWVAGHGYVAEAGSYTGDFIAREGSHLAYALCSRAGRTTARVPVFDLPGFHPSPSTGEEVLRPTTPGLVGRRVAFLAYSTGSLAEAAMRLPCIVAGSERLALPPLPPGMRAEVARCGSQAPYFVTASPVQLPRGPWCVRLVAPGHAPGPWTQARDLARGAAPLQPSAARLRWRVREDGKGLLPARILVRGLAGTADPHWGEIPDRGASLNVVYSEKGEGERPLPPGRYRITVDRGFEYAIHEEELAVAAGERATVEATLARVVDTRGWISADLHLHAVPSPDAPAPLGDRIRSLVAVGVEVGVATDHNAVTDYAPVIRELGVRPWVASIVGNEVTTKEVLFGHFNVFPLKPGSEPFPWRGTTPARIFAASRQAGPRTIIQVNHPRMRDLGYFELLRFDPGDVRGWAKRTPLADLGFDAIEVFNGDHYHAQNLPKVDEVLRDWYALLEAGYRYTATGNSDSHKLTYHEAGVPRNLVQVPNDDPASFDERAFLDSVRQGRVVVSSGPFVRLTAGGRGVGSTIPPGEVDVEVRVDAPPWVDVDRVELVRRGAVLRHWTGSWGTAAVRFQARERLRLEEGDWLVAVARGSKPMGLLHRPEALPLGFTNPIWVTARR